MAVPSSCRKAHLPLNSKNKKDNNPHALMDMRGEGAAHDAADLSNARGEEMRKQQKSYGPRQRQLVRAFQERSNCDRPERSDSNRWIGGVRCMDMPSELTVNGKLYIREDVAMSRFSKVPALERWYRVSELVDLTGFSQSSIYRAMDSGRLSFKCPNGSKSGRRVSETEWRRFLSSLA